MRGLRGWAFAKGLKANGTNPRNLIIGSAEDSGVRLMPGVSAKEGCRLAYMAPNFDPKDPCTLFQECGVRCAGTRQHRGVHAGGGGGVMGNAFQWQAHRDAC